MPEESPNPETAEAAETEPPKGAQGPSTLEFVAVVLLSVTTVLTAWSAFQSSKWGGEMSIAFSQASTARLEASRADAVANDRKAAHVGLWTQWVSAYGADNQRLSDFLESRFPEPLATAQRDWVATNPTTDGDTSTPFDMDSYVIAEDLDSAAADARADALFQDALANNARGDRYTLLTVLFAAVLFFAAMAQRFRSERIRWAMLGVAVVLLVSGGLLALSFPVKI